MPAVPKTTPALGLPRLAADDHTRLWEHYNLLVDKIDALFTSWQPYNVVWSQSDGAMLQAGSGKLTGLYKQLGKSVEVLVILDRAADSNVGSGNWIFSLPSPPKRWDAAIGVCQVLRNGSLYSGTASSVAATAFGLIVNGARVSHAHPTPTHKAGDSYIMRLWYEVA